MDRKYPSRGTLYGESDQRGTTSGYRRDMRKKIPLPVLVNYGKTHSYGMTHSGAWRTRDLSVGGTFVEMSAAELSTGAPVEVVLRFPCRQQTVEHRLPAKVVRINPDGVALQFDTYDDKAYTDLVNLLSAK
jgi:hypothetical protein